MNETLDCILSAYNIIITVLAAHIHIKKSNIAGLLTVPWWGPEVIVLGRRPISMVALAACDYRRGNGLVAMPPMSTPVCCGCDRRASRLRRGRARRPT